MTRGRRVVADALRHPAAVLGLALGLAALLTLGLARLAADDIAANQREFAAAQMRAVLAGVAHDTQLPPPMRRVDVELPDARVQAVAEIKRGGARAAVLVQATARGYNGDIVLLLAYKYETAAGTDELQADGRPAIRILRHTETAGIADFLREDPARAYDGVSGATISAAGIARAVGQVGEWLRDG